MEKVYNNILQSLTTDLVVPTYCIVITVVVLLVLAIVLIRDAVNISSLEVEVSDLELEVINLCHKVEAKESFIEMQKAQIKKKENLLQDAQKELSTLRPQVIDANRDKITKLENNHKSVGAKVGKSTPSTKKVENTLKSVKPTARRRG